MQADISKFQRWCIAAWGTERRVFGLPLAPPGMRRIQDSFKFDQISPALKVHIADHLIRESCSHVGSFAETGDVSWYICNFGLGIQGTEDGFGGRRRQPLKAALFLTALESFSSAVPTDSDPLIHIKAGGGAMAAMYLLAQLEFHLRRTSRYLKPDGNVQKKLPPQLTRQISRKPSDQRRINNVDQALTIFLYRNRTPLAKSLGTLERDLRLTQRLRMIRHPTMHGELADPGSEARFLALIIAMFHYDEVARATHTL